MRLTLIVIWLSAILSCTNDNNRNNVNPELTEPKSISLDGLYSFDTIRASFPVQIENDKGFVNVVGERTFKDWTLTNSSFTVTLNKIQYYSVSRYITKATLIDSNKTVLFRDSVNRDYLDGAIISSIKFDFVRSNTLHFKASLENPAKNKKIRGRFGLFYRTIKEGTVYGWITEEIN